MHRVGTETGPVGEVPRIAVVDAGQRLVGRVQQACQVRDEDAQAHRVRGDHVHVHVHPGGGVVHQRELDVEHLARLDVHDAFGQFAAQGGQASPALFRIEAAQVV